VAVVSSWLARLSTAQNALDLGTPRALPVFARERMGAVLKAGRPPLTPWPRGTCNEQGGHGRMDP